MFKYRTVADATVHWHGINAIPNRCQNHVTVLRHSRNNTLAIVPTFTKVLCDSLPCNARALSLV